MGLGPRRRAQRHEPSYYLRGLAPPHEERLSDGSNYTADEVELIQAMGRWMRANRCKFPAFTDVLRVLKSLGWRRGERE